LKSRIYILFSVLILMWAMLIGRGFSLQVVPDPRLKALESRQFQKTITLQSRRGALVDRQGRELAVSTTSYSVYADPKIIEKPKAVSQNLSRILGVSRENIYSKIKDKKRRFVWIERKMDEAKAEQIRGLKERGLRIVEEYSRIYPNESLLAPVLGMVGKEGTGLDGLELSLENFLRGNQQKVMIRRDARGRPLIHDGMMFAENPDGAEVKLTLDIDLQHRLERELQWAVEEFEADQAFGVILDARSSAVLSLARFPTFDANQAHKLSADIRRNRIVTDTFEPGSTMKTFVVAAGLRERTLAPNTKYNVEMGQFRIADRIIREADTKKKWDYLTASEILAYSSNIGITKIAFELGPEIVRNTLMDFGFGHTSGIDLPGEARGTLHPLPWKPHFFANVSFGHGMTATPLQIANAYAAIASGGVLHRPYVVHSIRHPETGVEELRRPEKIRRVMSEEDAAQLRLMLTGTTATGGTGVNAKVDGFLVAGKTGTAQKVNPNGRGYLPKAYISSFAGFLPAHDPRFVIYIAVDHPKKNAYYGSAVAAPLFSRVASYAVRQAGLSPMLLTERNLQKSQFSSAAQVRSAQQKKALEKISKSDRGTSDVHSPNVAAHEGSTGWIVPPLGGLTVREVLQKTQPQNIPIAIEGRGQVVRTVPEAGLHLGENETLRIFLE
jgi:cell division protein FtsI (penicillin-binding protein 3)